GAALRERDERALYPLADRHPVRDGAVPGLGRKPTHRFRSDVLRYGALPRERDQRPPPRERRAHVGYVQGARRRQLHALVRYDLGPNRRVDPRQGTLLFHLSRERRERVRQLQRTPRTERTDDLAAELHDRIGLDEVRRPYPHLHE